MDELESLREQRRQKLLSSQQKQQSAENQQADAERQLEDLLRPLLDDDARQRLSNVKLVNRELFLKAGSVILQLFNAGRVKDKVSDEQLRDLLQRLNVKKEIRIVRKGEKKF